MARLLPPSRLPAASFQPASVPLPPAEAIARPLAYLSLAPEILWVEVIDQDVHRDRLWVRPLALLPDGSDGVPYGLGDCPDLVLPQDWFHLALDTDALPLMDLLAGPRDRLQGGDPARHAFQQFLQRLWATAPRDRGSTDPM